MASQNAIGILRTNAIARIANACGLTLSTQGRDPQLLQAQQLDLIAHYLETKPQASAECDCTNCPCMTHLKQAVADGATKAQIVELIEACD